MSRFYAITSMGWGISDTGPDEAVKNYQRAQKRNFPGLTDSDLAESWGYVWKAGFVLLPPLDQRVANIGNVPEKFRV